MQTKGLGIDFVPQWRINWSGVGLFLAGIAILAYMAVFDIQAQKNISHWENKLAHSQMQVKQSRPKHADPASETEIAHMQSVIKRLNVPWQQLFDALEKTISSDITLTSLLPDPKKGVVYISGEARSLYAVLEYAQLLQGTKYFGDVELAEHEVSEAHEGMLVSFKLSLRWKSL